MYIASYSLAPHLLCYDRIWKDNRAAYAELTQNGTKRAPNRKRQQTEIIDTAEKDTFRVTAELGRLWPVNLMKLHKPEVKIGKGDIIEVRHKGQAVKGVVLARDEGWKLLPTAYCLFRTYWLLPMIILSIA